MENLDISMQHEATAEKKKGRHFDAHEYKKKRIADFLIQTSGKMVLIDKLLPKLKSEGHKVRRDYVHAIRVSCWLLFWIFNLMRLTSLLSIFDVFVFRCPNVAPRF